MTAALSDFALEFPIDLALGDCLAQFVGVYVSAAGIGVLRCLIAPRPGPKLIDILRQEGC